MYIPDAVDIQLPLAELPAEVAPEQFPNVTKGISEVLEMCEAAGLDSKGFGCGMSVPFRWSDKVDNRLLSSCYLLQRYFVLWLLWLYQPSQVSACFTSTDVKG